VLGKKGNVRTAQVLHSGTIFIEWLDLLTGGFDGFWYFAANGASSRRIPRIMSRPPLNSPSAGTRAGSLGEVQSLDPTATDPPVSSPLLRTRTDSIASPLITVPAPPRSGGTTVPFPEAVEPSSTKNRSERLDLARGAPEIMRKHLFRAVVRISVLLTGDACALLVLRFIMQGIRDQAWLGPTVASLASSMIPMGAVPLVQLLPAVFLGLIVLDNYGASDRRRDAGRLLAGSAFGLALPFWG
jgi:hypothetical protein